MSPSYGAVDIPAEVRRTTEASGVPYYVQDEATLESLARMFVGAIKTAKPRRGNEGINPQNGDDPATLARVAALFLGALNTHAKGSRWNESPKQKNGETND